MMTSSPSLNSEAYRRIEEMIVTQVLKPGSKVSELDLSKELGIGRTPIREALQRLGREGLVIIRPRHGIFISQMTIERQLQLLELREVTERFVIQCAVCRADVDQRARMLQLAKAIEDAAEIGDGPLYFRISREIHNLLCEAARNEFLSSTMANIYALARQFGYIFYKNAGSLVRGAARHAEILRAGAARDEEAALEASSKMIGYLREFTEDSKRIAEGRKRPGDRRSAAQSRRAAVR